MCSTTGDLNNMVTHAQSASEATLLRASSWRVTTPVVLLVSRSSRFSPMQKMTLIPVLRAAAVLKAESKGQLRRTKRERKPRTHLLSDELVGLVEEGTALRVAEDDPLEVDVLELLKSVREGENEVSQTANHLISTKKAPNSRDLSGVGSGRKLVSVLGGDGDLLLCVRGRRRPGISGSSALEWG